MKILKTFVLPVAFVALLLFIDQITKYLAVVHLKPIGTYDIIEGIFALRYLENSGMAFGLLQNGRWFFVILTVIILAAIVYFYATLPKTKYRTITRVFLLMLIGGALGNFADRLFNGYVVDFLAFTFIDFPVFNIADVFLVVSVVFLIIFFLLAQGKEPKEDVPKNEE